ncbi:hypothetical protein V1511DRAFT_498486 [Dipodascopsis uninucleata]
MIFTGTIRKSLSSRWLSSFFVLGVFQAIFTIIPMAIIAKFIEMDQGDKQPRPYIFILSISIISLLVIFFSRAMGIYYVCRTNISDRRSGQFSQSGYCNSQGGAQSEEENEALYHQIANESPDEEVLIDNRDRNIRAVERSRRWKRRASKRRGISIIDLRAGRWWPIGIIIIHIIMTLLWFGMFLYIMDLTGGISTSCSIPEDNGFCRSLNQKELCSSFESACHLVNLIVISCTLDFCFWLLGLFSLFVDSTGSFRWYRSRPSRLRSYGSRGSSFSRRSRQRRGKNMSAPLSHRWHKMPWTTMMPMESDEDYPEDRNGNLSTGSIGMNSLQSRQGPEEINEFNVSSATLSYTHRHHLAMPGGFLAAKTRGVSYSSQGSELDATSNSQSAINLIDGENEPTDSNADYEITPSYAPRPIRQL